MSNQRLYNHGPCNVQSGRRRILFALISIFRICVCGVFSLVKAVVPDGRESLWCVPAQKIGTTLSYTYRLKERNLCADISPNVEGCQDERVRFLLPFDSHYHQHTQGLRL